MRFLVHLVLPLVASAAGATAAHGQAPLSLERITGAVHIDGLTDDAAWKDITPLPLVVYEPVFRGEMSEYTEIRVAYDDQYLYLSGIMLDGDPEKIRSNSMYRDRYSGDDTFSIILDTFNDRENALWFATNPNGIRLDLTITNDLQYGGPSPFGSVISSAWNTYWDVATTRNTEGWFAEMRIPLSSLGFQDDDGMVVMGMSVHRFISRKNERHVFPATPPNWSMAYAKPSQLQRVSLDGTASRHPVYITPYAAGGASAASMLTNAGSTYNVESDFTTDVGGDVKTNLTDNLTLDLTVNTDFAQAEADDEQVNLTRFSLFFPEKRQFFQQRAGIFEYRTQGRYDRLFHTRQIGLYEERTIPIIGGARLVGRIGTWDTGMINLQTAARDELPSENFGVLRLRRQVFNSNSYLGGIVTSRIGANGTWNWVYGLDGIIRVGGKEYLELKWAQTFDDADIGGDRFHPKNNGYGRVRLERRTQVGLSYIVSTTWEGEAFNPGIGFVSRTGFVQPFVVVGYGWFAAESSRILSSGPRLVVTTYLRNEDRSVESSWYRLAWQFRLKSGATHSLEVEVFDEDLRTPVSFPEDTEVPPGRYAYHVWSWNYTARDGQLFRTDARVSGGSFFDGTNVEFEAEPTWNLSRHVELGATYRFNRVRFPERDVGFYVHLARVRAQIGFTTRISLNTFLQYNTAADALSANLRFRYNFREGNDLWIVYNESRNTNRLRMMPHLPGLDGRTLLLKYTYTFIR